MTTKKNMCSALVLIGLSSAAAAQDITTSQVYIPTTPSEAAAQSGAVSTGPAGVTGLPGYYVCEQMTCGEACAEFYSFGSYRSVPATNGGAAPGGASGTQVTLDSNQVVSIDNSGSANVGVYDIVVSQLASAMIRSTEANDGSNGGLRANDVVNGGAAFDLILTPSGGTAQTLSFVAGSTLQDVADRLDAVTGFSAELGVVPDNAGATTDYRYISVSGEVGSGNDFTLLSETVDPNDPSATIAVAELEFETPASTTFETFDYTQNPPVSLGFVTETPLGIQSQDAEFTVNGGPTLSSTSNSGIALADASTTVSFASAGTVRLSVIDVSSLIPNGQAGLAGSDGTAISEALGSGFSSNPENILITSTGLAFSGSTTGGQGGDAGIGGTGGQCGAGGAAVTDTVPRIMAIIFPPLTIPDTDVLLITGGIGGAGASGATGGDGLVGGDGGDISFALSDVVRAEAGTLINMLSTGGQGGQGGQGGTGGQGGDGGAAAATVEADDMIPYVFSSAGNIGGVGGQGGQGGSGGTGGSGGGVVVSLDVATVDVVDGAIAQSIGGQGGTGGTGGQGGQGGTGGLGVAMRVGIGTAVENGQAGGRGGIGYTGGTGGIGGAGGGVTLSNTSEYMSVTNTALIAL